MRKSEFAKTVRYWRLNSIAALKMMNWRHENVAQDPEEYAQILANKKELNELQEREKAIKSRHARIYQQTRQP